MSKQSLHTPDYRMNLSRTPFPGDISPHTRFTLLVLSLITLGVLLALALPYALAFFFQLAGGQELDQAIRASRGIESGDILCALAPIPEEEARLKVGRARSHLETAINYNPNLAQAHLQLARANCLMGGHERAVHHYQTFNELREGNPLGHLELGFVHEALGEHEAAVREWRQAGVVIADVLAAGRQSLQNREFDQAEYWFLIAARLDPDNPEPWIGLGDAAFERFEISKSLERYQTAWELDPLATTSDLVMALMRSARYREAIQILEQSLSTYLDRDERLQWWVALGDSYAALEQWENAINAYGSAIDEFSSVADLHLALGWAVYRGEGDAEKAIRHMKQAIPLDESPGNIYYAIGQVLFEDQRPIEALTWFNQAIESNPINTTWRLTRVNAVRSAGRLDQAIQDYDTLLETNPNFDPALYELSWAYYLNKQYDKASIAIEQAIEQMPTEKPWYYSRAGLIYEELGDRDRAVDLYLRALELNPDDELAKTRLEKIQDN